MIISRLRRVVDRVLQRERACFPSAIGPGADIDPGTRFIFPDRIRIGEHVHIGPGAYLNGRGGLSIGDHVIIAPEVAVMSSMHRFRDASMIPYDNVEMLKPVTIGRCVWIGMRAMLLPGVDVGEGSIVGAGAVVARSCPPGSLLAGNPAKIIGTRDMEHYRACVEKGRFYLKLKLEQGFQKEEQRA